MILEYANYISWGLEQTKNIRLLSIHSGWGWKFRWSYTPDTICRNYCSLQEYSQDTLFIPLLLHEIAICSNTIIENTHSIHNILTIQTGTIR